ncbi:MAG: hypothetical protein H6841_08825 [Planctomycetes bacterium]|nr:hypothetical protein [Planctomycetota bacterium]MCB9936142.1 hypothetical protein [Planctomycetota bacterium]
MIIALATCVAFAVADATETLSNTGLEFASTAYFASSNEELDINYTTGNAVEVHGDGKITTGNSQNWTVYAKDGLKWQGTITDSDWPRWKLYANWNYDLEAYGTGSGGTNHRALAGCYGVAQKDLNRSSGQEYDINAAILGGESTYTFPVTPPDGDGSGYTIPGSKKSSGGYTRVGSGNAFAMDDGIWVDKETVNVWVFVRGWMTLKSNGNTTDVHTEVDTTVMAGGFDAWDYGVSPPKFIRSYDLN